MTGDNVLSDQDTQNLIQLSICATSFCTSQKATLLQPLRVNVCLSNPEWILHLALINGLRKFHSFIYVAETNVIFNWLLIKVYQ